MPLYKWYGITHDHITTQGQQFARGIPHLQEILQEQRTMLIATQTVKRSISITALMKERIAVLAHLGTLMNAGVRLVDALETVAASTQHAYLRLILLDCAAALREGIPLSIVATYHPELFSPLACCMFTACENTGTLGSCCQNLAQDYASIDHFVHTIRSTLFMPCITLCGSIIIFFIILYAIVPRLSSLLLKAKTTLPYKTKILIAMSTFIHTPFGIVLLTIIAVSIVAGILLLRRSLHTQIPFVIARWAIVHDLSAAIFFRTLGLLLKGGVPLLTALRVAPWEPMKQQYGALAQLTEEGVPFSTAVQQTIGPLEPFCATLLKVGEATGSLAQTTTACGEFYQKRVTSWCTTMGKLAQPTILILLGLFVAFIMVALYEPILTLGTTLT